MKGIGLGIVLGVVASQATAEKARENWRKDGTCVEIQLDPKKLAMTSGETKTFYAWRFQSEYFFCSTNGKMVCSANLRKRVWIPTLKKAGVPYRDMKQTRHSFATNALSCMENPLWIARFMGHRDTNMIIKVYSKYISDGTDSIDGHKLDKLYAGLTGKQG